MAGSLLTAMNALGASGSGLTRRSRRLTRCLIRIERAHGIDRPGISAHHAPMSVAAFDTLAYARRLKEAGVDEAQAEVPAETEGGGPEC